MKRPLVWRVEESAIGRFYIVRGYNNLREVWKSFTGASDFLYEKDAQSIADALNNG